MSQINLEKSTVSQLVVIADDNEIETICNILGVNEDAVTEGEYQGENQYEWTIKLIKE